MKLYTCPSKILFILLFSHFYANAQNESINYKYSVLNIPPSKNLFTSFSVTETSDILLPLNGGIYVVNDSLWFIPPSKQYFFTSVATNIIDTGVFVFANTLDSSKLFCLKNSLTAPIQRSLIVQMSKGIYNVIFKNNICYVWGHTGTNSKIGILVNKEVKWLINLKGVIQQVQVNSLNEIYFSLGKSIYQLNNQKKILTLEKEIHGFCFTKDDKIILSSIDGVGIYEHNNISIFASELDGLLEQKSDKLFLVSNKNKQVYILYK